MCMLLFCPSADDVKPHTSTCNPPQYIPSNHNTTIHPYSHTIPYRTHARTHQADSIITRCYSQKHPILLTENIPQKYRKKLSSCSALRRHSSHSQPFSQPSLQAALSPHRHRHQHDTTVTNLFSSPPAAYLLHSKLSASTN